MADKIQIRRDTAANWAAANPLLAQGELVMELSPMRFKVGDGVTAYNSLPYSFESTGGGGTTDHGLLAGLTDDDHPQYHDDTRGDARYYTQAQIDSQQSTQDTAIAANMAANTANGAANAVNAANIASNDNDISTLQADQATQDTAISGNATDIATNSTDIATNAGDITTNATNLQNHIDDDTNPHSTSLLNLSDMITNAYTGGDRFFLIKTNAAGDGVELWENFERTAVRDTPLLHQGADYEIYLPFTVNIPVTGDYAFIMSYRYSINTTTSNFEAHLEKDGDFLLITHAEAQDAAGTGILVPNSTGGTTNTGTDIFATITGYHNFVGLAAGSHTFNLEFRGQAINQEPTIYEAEMLIKRIAE